MLLSTIIVAAFMVTLVGSAISWSLITVPVTRTIPGFSHLAATGLNQLAARCAGGLAGLLVPIQGILLGLNPLMPWEDPALDDGKMLLYPFLILVGFILGISFAGFVFDRMSDRLHEGQIFIGVFLAILWPISMVLLPLSLLPIYRYTMPWHPVYSLHAIGISLGNAGVSAIIILAQAYRWRRRYVGRIEGGRTT